VNVASTRPGSRVTPGEGPVYFIADAHLGSETPETEAAKVSDLTSFLGWLSGRASYLYLVGDLFDFWFEFRIPGPLEHREVLEALAALSGSGTSVHFLGGNHDFWAGPRLETLTGATVHRRPIEVTHFGRRIFIAHGDGLPRGDWGYCVLRAVIRSGPAIAAFRLVGPRFGRAIGRWASSLSEITEERIRRALPPMRDFLRATVDSGPDACVVGHVHRPALWEWENGTGVIVGDWMANRSVVSLGKDGFSLGRWSDGRLIEVGRRGGSHGMDAPDGDGA